MSSYEALVDLNSQMGLQFRKVCEESDDLIRISEKIISLVEDGVADLGNPYLSRVERATRSIGASRQLGTEALREVSDVLRSIETMRVRRDVAVELKDDSLVQEQEQGMARAIPIAQSELENVFTLIEYMKLTLKDLAPPHLIVG
jgi:uncharacterized protein YsxB (DUF464 family)